MAWSLIEEIGLEYAPTNGISPRRELRLPVSATRALDGSTLIVDERSPDKCVPVRTEFRTLRVNPAGHVVSDTAAMGIDDAYGCALPDGRSAWLRVTQWELWILNASDHCERVLDLARLSKHMPACIAGTPRGTFLIAFVDRVFEVDIVEIDAHGSLLWYLAAGQHGIGCPSSLQLLPSDRILLADEFCHVAVEITRAGEVVWRYGASRDPGSQPGRLSSPRAVREAPDGRRLIADTRNHRVLAVEESGSVGIVPIADGACSPTFADRLANGHVLVCDSASGRVIECDDTSRIVWHFGEPVVRRRALSFPRSVEPNGQGGLLVCDTANDRVVELHDGRIRTLPFNDQTPLRWPRCARRAAGDRVVVADGLNSRIVEVAADGQVTRMLTALGGSREIPLGDPHDVQALDGERLLITDPKQNLVGEADWQGRIHRLVGGHAASGDVELADPHNAQLLPDGILLICDTGHHRLIWIAPDGRVVNELESVQAGRQTWRLNRPRYACVSPDGQLVIVDTGNNRVLGADPDRQLIWELSRIVGSPFEHLDQPRWALMVGRELLVSDNYQHRVVRLRHDVGESPVQ